MLVFFIFGNLLNAQVKVGIRGGMNLSTISPDIVDNNKKQDFDCLNRTAYIGGFYIDIPIIKNFTIQPGVFYTSKGVSFRKEKKQETKTTRLNVDTYKRYDVIESTYSLTKNTEEHNYVEIPLLFTYKLSLSQSVYVQFGAGPYAAYLLGVKTKKETELRKSVRPDLYKETRAEKDSDSNTVELGGDFGDRMDYGVSLLGKVSWKKIGIGVGYDYGFKNINEMFYSRNLSIVTDFYF